jgi:hypothetical protein
MGGFMKTKSPKKESNNKTKKSESGTSINKEFIAEATTSPDETKVSKKSKRLEKVLASGDAAAMTLKRKLDIEENFGKSSSFFIKALMNNEKFKFMETAQVVKRLLAYADLFASWDHQDTIPLHNPSRVYGFIWDITPPQDRSELHESIIDKYLLIATLQREAFEDILTQAKLIFF